MKFVRFDAGRTGLVVGPQWDQVLDIRASLDALDRPDREQISRVLSGDGSGTWTPMIEDWPHVRPVFQRLEALGAAQAGGTSVHPLRAVRLQAPLPSPERRIFSLGANTVNHIVAASARLPGSRISADDIYKPKLSDAPPMGFSVFPDAVIGPDGVVTPPAFVRKLDYEGECAAIVGSAGRNQGPHTVIWGYTSWNDFGMRDGHLGMIPVMPSLGYSFNLWKNWDTANACGPWVVVDEGRDVQNLQCELFVNGERRQSWNTSEMIYTFAETFDHLSRYIALKPGDVATSGTGAGSAMEGPVDSNLWLRPGDVLEVRLDGVAPLVNTVGPW